MMMRLVWYYFLLHPIPMNKKWSSNLSPTLRETHHPYHGTARQASPGQDKIFEAFVSGLEKITPTPSLQSSSRVPQKDDRG